MIIMTQEFGMDNTVLIGENNNNNNSSKMTATTTIANNHQDDDEHEEGEILEDGEIADDDDNNNNDDCSMLMVDKTNVNKKINEGSFETNEGNNNNNNQIRNNKINNYNTYGGANHNNNSQHGKNHKFGFFPPPPPPPPSSNGSAKNHSNDNRDDVFGYVPTKLSRRKRRGDRGKKRRFSSSQDHPQGSSPTKRHKFLSPSSSPNANNNSNINNNNNSNNNETTTTTSAGQRELINLTQQMNDSSFDSVELSDENEFKFDLIEFDVFMEILGCKIDENEEIILQKNVPDLDKSKLMCRIVKIMKKLHGNDPDTARRFARLKRRSKEKQNAMNGGGGIGGDEATVVAAKNVYKTPCKFYLEGKCHKGSDCLYSHNMPIPKRKELCKFYLQGFCGKGDDCLFMHEEFPCKFFHTNTKCFAGEGCRFSHKPLTDELREILRSYLDSGTFPDEVKPYRPINHVNDWLKDDDPDSQDFDYEALLSSKTRKVLLGPPTQYMRNQSIETWRWQQGLKESEQSYVGTKKNLFSIDDGLAMLEKPPTPRIEDDDEEIEAHIRNYYNDLLDTDEYDELIHIKEIEELEMKVKLEKEQPKLSETIKPVMETTIEQQLPPPILEMSEEEKRLIEASALDEDLRILPQPFTLPPAFQNAGLPSVPQPPLSQQPVSVPLPNIQQQQLPPPLPIVGVQSTPSQSIVSQTSPFNSFASNLPDQSLSSSMEQQQSSAVVPGFGITSAVPSSLDVSEMQQPAVAAIARDPRIRDPRLNSSNRSMTSNLGNTSSSSSTTTNIGSNIASIANATNKPEIKVIKSNPNLVIKYRLIPADVEPINYSKYHDLYQNEGPLKNDPRLKRFFVNPPPINTNENQNNEPSSGTMLGAHWTTNMEQKSEQQIATITSAANTNLIMKPSIETIASPPQSMSTTNQAKPEILGIIGNVRDPRMRSKDLDQRNNSIDTKNSDSNTSITSTGSTDQNKNDWDVSGKLCFNNNSNCSANKNQDNNDSNQNSINSSSCNSNASFNNMNSMDRDNTNSISNNDGMNLSSIPSYALSAIPPAQSLFSSVSTNLFYGTSGTGSGIENSNINNDSNKINDQEEDDDDDDDESDQLKVDECLIINSNEDEDNNDDTPEDDDIQNLSKRRSPTTTTSTASITATKSSDWADKMKSMDSDNEQEMEIVIQSNQNEDSINNNDSNNNNNNNESESECENDLVIATSSSETEDNNTTTATNNNNNSNNNSSSKEYYDSGSNNGENVDDNQIINDSSNNQNICANNESTITNIN